MLFISCGDLTHSAVSSAYRKFEVDLPAISALDSVICVPYKYKIIVFEYCVIHVILCVSDVNAFLNMQFCFIRHVYYHSTVQ